MSDFSKIRSHEDPCLRFGKLFAELYYYMGKNILEEMGDEKGSQLVEKALKEFAEYRVANTMEEAAERGISIDDIKNMEDYFKIRDMPDCGWINGDERGIVIRCLLEAVWNKYGEIGMKLGQLYCAIDYILYGAFGLYFDRPLCKTTGDDICVFHFKEKE